MSKSEVPAWTCPKCGRTHPITTTTCECSDGGNVPAWFPSPWHPPTIPYWWSPWYPPYEVTCSTSNDSTKFIIKNCTFKSTSGTVTWTAP